MQTIGQLSSKQGFYNRLTDLKQFTDKPATKEQVKLFISQIERIAKQEGLKLEVNHRTYKLSDHTGQNFFSFFNPYKERRFLGIKF